MRDQKYASMFADEGFNGRIDFNMSFDRLSTIERLDALQSWTHIIIEQYNKELDDHFELMRKQIEAEP